MKMMSTVSDDVIRILELYDTPATSNAIEYFNVRMRNEGHVSGKIRSAFPLKGSAAGYAVPGRIRTASPPIANLCYYHRMDWWEYVAGIPGPKILVVEDADRIPGVGALFGEIHANIARTLGCVAYVTNGTVRDVPALEKMGFPCFSMGTSVSHAYAHLVEFGEPVEILGLKVSEGDLIQADIHGVQSIPPEVAGRLGHEIELVLAREAELISLCQRWQTSPQLPQEAFLDKLKGILGGELRACQPPTRFSI